MSRLYYIIKWFLLTRYRCYFLNSREKLAKWHDKQAQHIVRYAVKHSLFYENYYQGLNLKNWQNLPLINKQTFIDKFDQINTVNIDHQTAYATAIQAEQTRDFNPMINHITVGLSSGTSGSRSIFLVNEEERFSWAGAVLAKMLPKPFSRQRIAFFLRANSNIYTSIKNSFIQFEFYDLLTDLELQIKKLNEFNPTILIAPASMLKMIAKAKHENALLIQPIKIISVAEVLEPADKKYIEKQFNQLVHQIYQATEGFLATTCHYGTLHLNEDLIIFQKEYLDKEQKKFTPIITDLYRKTQPIIRYQLNDILTEQDEPCPCGSIYTAIKQIDGRCDDLFYVLSTVDQTLKPLFPDFIRRAIITSTNENIEYDVIQTSPTHLQINLQCSKKEFCQVSENIEKNILSLFKQIDASTPTLTFGEYASPKKGVKLRRLVRKFPV